MKFSEYLHYRRGIIGMFALFGTLFIVTFSLFSVPLSAVLYPGILCVIIAAGIMCSDYLHIKRRHELLRKFLTDAEAVIGTLPPPEGIAEHDYADIISALCLARLEQENASKKQLASMKNYYTLWAHQIKTPLASMRLHLQGEDSALSLQLQNDLGHIEQYVDMVLAYVRLDCDSTDYVIRSFELDGVIRAALRKFSGDFIAGHLSLHYSPLGVSVLSDEKWLQFVIEQVLSNAVKYTRSGDVYIYLEEPMTLCIRDTGIGIAPEDLPRIFENGFTGFNGRYDKRASGIGLYLCRRICSRLGHTISAQSVPGEGTCIRIDLETRRIGIE